jgi:hypothetical protein
LIFAAAWKNFRREDLINLERTVLAHEAELDRQSREIAALMDDLKVGPSGATQD